MIIPQSSNTAETLPSDYLVSYSGHSLGGVLPLCRGAVGVFYSPQLTEQKTIKTQPTYSACHSHPSSVTLFAKKIFKGLSSGNQLTIMNISFTADVDNFDSSRIGMALDNLWTVSYNDHVKSKY